MTETSKKMIAGMAGLVGCAFIVLLVYVAVRPGSISVTVEETKSHMKLIAVAIEEYRYVQVEKRYDPLTEANWVTQLACAPESRVIIGALPKNVWSAENTTEFRDSWGQAIVFAPKDDPQGQPVLTSAGPDGDITTEEDNVRYPR